MDEAVFKLYPVDLCLSPEGTWKKPENQDLLEADDLEEAWILPAG